MGARRPLSAGSAHRERPGEKASAYLDASAVVKLMIAERESEALLAFLADWPLRISSRVVQVELTCVCHRQGIPTAEAEELISGIRLLPVTDDMLRGALKPFTPPQRALDALHLATAQHAQSQIGCFLTYDSEQSEAAAALGFHVASPAPPDEPS